jgi:hypothetical protein
LAPFFLLFYIVRNVFFQVSPEGKAEIIKKFANKGVAMVGDGVNDVVYVKLPFFLYCPFPYHLLFFFLFSAIKRGLAASDTSIAMGGGTDILPIKILVTSLCPLCRLLPSSLTPANEL